MSNYGSGFRINYQRASEFYTISFKYMEPYGVKCLLRIDKLARLK